jgi:hypothetical protein
VSDHPGLHTCNQEHARWRAANIEAVRWDSVAAQQAVERTCQEVSLRCQRVIARYVSVDISEEYGHHPGPREERS